MHQGRQPHLTGGTFQVIRNFFAGHVSRVTLLSGLLLGFASFFGTVILGILMIPDSFDWRKRVLSQAISPRHNPDGYWIPALGVAAAALLFLPFAGFLERCLRTITPRGARAAGVAFTLSSLLFIGVSVPLPAQLPPGLGRLHEVFARGATAAIIVGMLCCCVGAFKDRRFPVGRRRLRNRLSVYWMSLPLMLIAFGLVCCILVLGRKMGLPWALQAGEALRPTLLWQLAFWEWVGVATFFAFLFITGLWLPGPVKSSVSVQSQPIKLESRNPYDLERTQSTWTSAAKNDQGWGKPLANSESNPLGTKSAPYEVARL